MRFVAGWDGGGTKTAVVVADERGTEVLRFTAGPLNYNGQDEASIARNVRDMLARIGEACGGLAHCEQLCIGAAGVSHPAVVERLEVLIRSGGYAGGLRVTGDHETALYGAHDRPDGIILIAGTGSICYGRHASGSEHRTGGFGYLIDDEGSGYSIGRDLLAATVRAHDGRIAETAIAEMVYDRLGMTTVRELVGFVYDRGTNKKDIAAIAPVLTEACEAGDRVALEIASRNAAALAELVVPVAERLALQEGALAMAGSVLLNNAYVRSAFEAELARRYPAMACIEAKHDAVHGAVRMALDRMKE